MISPTPSYFCYGTYLFVFFCRSCIKYLCGHRAWLTAVSSNRSLWYRCHLIDIKIAASCQLFVVFECWDEFNVNRNLFWFKNCAVTELHFKVGLTEQTKLTSCLRFHIWFLSFTFPANGPEPAPAWRLTTLSQALEHHISQTNLRSVFFYSGLFWVFIFCAEYAVPRFDRAVCKSSSAPCGGAQWKAVSLTLTWVTQNMHMDYTHP